MNTEFKYSYHTPGEHTYAVLERIIHDLVTHVRAFNYDRAEQRLRQKRAARPFDLDSHKYDAMYDAVVNAVNNARDNGSDLFDLQPEEIVKQNRRILWGHTDVRGLHATPTK